MAKDISIPISKKFKNGEIILLDRFENGKPVYTRFNSLNAAKTISSNKLWWEGNLGYDLSGYSIYAGLWDASGIWTGHSEYSLATILHQDTPFYWDAPHPHGMAGIMLSKGENYPNGPSNTAKGMAKSMTLNVFDKISDIAELLTASNWIRVSNHSYADNCGWHYINSESKWIWWGDTTVNSYEDYKFGNYNEKASDLDEITNMFQPYRLMITAAGNDRSEIGPGPNGLHYLMDADSDFTITSYTTRAEDGGFDKFECIPSGFPTAKNVLTVGAVLDIVQGYSIISDVQMTTFSSWGPTDDGRIKPDIVANGFEIICTDIAYDLNDNPIDAYQQASGTSGAAASVSGSCALILEYYEDLFPLRTAMLASTLKALIIHTADEAGNPGPDYKFGWGLMNTKSAVELINTELNDGEGTHIAEMVLTSGSILDIEIQPTGQDSLILTLCWSDPAGPYPLSPALNPTTKRLVNDLDLVLTNPNNNDHYTYNLNPSSPDDIATFGDNNTDNVEKIIVEYPLSGNYIAHISYDGFLQGDQNFSLILSGGKFTEPDTSNPPPPPPDSNYYKVTVDQKLSDDSTSISSVRAWNYSWGLWNDWDSVPVDYYAQKYPLAPSYKTIRATNNIYSNEKFNKWTSSNGYNFPVIWGRFEFTQDISVKSNLKPLHNVTIKNQIFPGINNGTIYFKDPWYIDYTDSSYYYVYNNDPSTLSKPSGFRNKVNSAPFEKHNSPFNITIDPPRKGVFLDLDPNIHNVYYSVRADEYTAATDGIYEFSHWEAEPDSSAEFENANARETAVVFRQDGAIVKALYQAVNQIPGYTLTIAPGEELNIPAGANIQCAEGFAIEVEGSLIAEGTKEQPITLTSSGKLSSFDPFDLDYSMMDSQSLIKSIGANSNLEMRHVVIKNAKYALQLNNTGSTIEIKNVEVHDSNMGILINRPNDCIIILDSLYLHDNDCGISFGNAQADQNQESVVIIDRSIFANCNDIAIHFTPKGEYELSLGILSEIYLSILSSTFWNNTQGIYFQNVGSINFGYIYTDVVSTIFEQSHCTFYTGHFPLRWSPANVYYNSGGMPLYLAEILEDPLLINPQNGNFHLSGNSPCIDAGDHGWCVPEYDDYCIDDEDIDGTLPDIGVHFYPKLQGTISEDMTLSGEIQVLNYLTIADGVTLTIEENSTVFVNAGKKINVYGSLDAQGTAANKITFTRSDPNNTSSTYWYGIYGISADNLNLTHCEIEGARYGSYVKYEPAMFDNVLFETCNTGIKFYYSENSIVINSDFDNCGNAITLSRSTTNISKNTMQDCDYGIWSIRGFGSINENIIGNNNYDGIYLTDMSGLQLTAESEGEIFPVNNVIENNNRYGVYINSNSNPDLGTYFEIPEFIRGGFNQFNRGAGSYDIYSLNESIIKAEVNYWPNGINYSGIIDVNPTVNDLGGTMMAKITSVDSLENLISIGDSLAADSSYSDAIGFYRSVIDAEPDNNISIKALIKLLICYKKMNDLNALLTELDDIYNSYRNNKVGTAALDNSVTIYSLLGDYTEALSRSETVVNIYIADPTMIEQAAAALYEQAMIYETLALLRPGLGKDAMLANKSLCYTKILKDYPDTDAAKYLILFERIEDLFVQTEIIPKEYVLNPAFPNPFNSTVNFRFGLKEDANVDLVIFDILGRKVWEYKSSDKMEAGYHNIRWHGINSAGNSVASGLYLVKLKANNFTGSQKVILVK